MNSYLLLFAKIIIFFTNTFFFIHLQFNFKLIQNCSVNILIISYFIYF